jgi:xanthine dehydrogenase accessory factor
VRVDAVLLAAGSATRMGADKLALDWRGRSLFERALTPLLEAPSIGEVIAVVRPGWEPPIRPDGVRFVLNPDHATGMASSLLAGVGALDPAADAFVVALGDMPELSPALIDALVVAFEESDRPILVPVLGGHRGHPVVFDRTCAAMLAGLSGDRGARGLLRDRPELVHEHPVEHRGVLLDVDQPDDLPRGAPGAPLDPKILVKGAGEQASGTAHRLVRAGFRVAMTETAAPAAVRRAVSFCQAVFDGATEVEGVRARLWSLDDAGRLDTHDWAHVPVFVDPDGRLIPLWRPDVVIDARLLKRNLDNRLEHAPLVIGLGPGLVAGRDVHVVVETNRGHDLGRLIRDGAAAADTGVPGTIGGEGARRVLRAPRDGVVEGVRRIGDRVVAGDLVARVDGAPVTSALHGVVRGLVHPDVAVRAGQKLGDVDPRGEPGHCDTLSDKTRTISGAVLEAVLAFGRQRRS